MHKAVLALCQEFTTQLLCSQDPNNWGMALRIKRKYFHALSVRIERMGYKINNMAKELITINKLALVKEISIEPNLISGPIL